VGDLDLRVSLAVDPIFRAHLEVVPRIERLEGIFTKSDKGLCDVFEILEMGQVALFPVRDTRPTWSGTIRILMSADTFLGMTVLFTAPEDVMLAIENEGSRQTFTSSSNGRPHASETS